MLVNAYKVLGHIMLNILCYIRLKEFKIQNYKEQKFIKTDQGKIMT